MQTTIQWKGYIAKIEYDQDIRKFYGIVQNATSVITFYGSSVEELEQEFENSMLEYFKVCEESGRQPDKPYSGKFSVRLTPQMHGRIVASAIQAGKSVNKWVADTLEHSLMIKTDKGHGRKSA